MKYNESYFRNLELLFSHNEAVMELNGKSVFITGSTGLIGSSIADYLLYLKKNKGLNVTLYLGARNIERLSDRFCYYELDKDYFFVDYDISKSVNGFSCDYIIHAASNADPSRISSEPVETILANVKGLGNILDYARINKLKRVLFISSSEIYGKKDNNLKYKETDYGYIDVLNPRACYPLSKRAGENLCIAYSMEYGVDTVIVRPGHVYGPQITANDNRASADFTRNVLDGKNILMKSNGEQLRSYCYSLDCVSAIIDVLIKGESKTAYNISNPDSICTIREFAEELAEQNSVSVVFENSTETEKKSYNLMNNSSLDSNRLESLGWKGLFSLKDGIKAMMESM